MNSNIIDSNYNVVAVTTDNKEHLLFADRLHNENLDNWQGWHCAAGSKYLVIDPNFDVYGSMCQNDYLGNLETDFKLLNEYTICKKVRCVHCTNDLMVHKYDPKFIDVK